MEIDLNDYVIGGYFVTKSVERIGWTAADGESQRLLSVARCLAPVVPTVYVYEYAATYDPIYAEFGIGADKLEALMQWQKQNRPQMGWPEVFCSLQTARAFVTEFVTDSDEVAILAVAIPRREIDEFFTHDEDDDGPLDPADDMNEFTDEPLAELGCEVDGMIELGEPPPSGGDILGFEMLVYEEGAFPDSWRCHSTESLPEVAINEHGFIDTLRDARRVDRAMNADPELDVHGPWSYWLIIKYPLEGEHE